MAFMIPVVRKDYNVYSSSPSSRNSSASSSRNSSLASSPTAASFVSSPRTSETPVSNMQRKSSSQSQVSMHNFHSKVLDKLKKTFRGSSASVPTSSSFCNVTS